MSRSRPVTYLSIEELVKLPTHRLRAYKRRLKVLAGAKDDPNMSPADWIKYTELVDKMVQRRRHEEEAKIPYEDRLQIWRGEIELPGHKVPLAQQRAAKRYAIVWEKRVAELRRGE